MYSTFPKRDQNLIRGGLAGAWGLLATSGAGGLLFPPTSITESSGQIPHTITSLLLLISSLIALYGILRQKWQYEWISAWFASAGLVLYVFTLWSLVLSTTPSRLQQAAAVTALIGFTCYRIASCSAHARRLRKLHEELQGVKK